MERSRINQETLPATIALPGTDLFSLVANFLFARD
jgi:hypothetical protein